MVLSINSLLGALVSAALDLGAAGVAVVRGARALGDVHLVVARHDETEAPLRVDGRHLHGPRSMVYVRELIQMMQRCPFSEWAVRADWMGRLLRSIRSSSRTRRCLASSASAIRASCSSSSRGNARPRASWSSPSPPPTSGAPPRWGASRRRSVRSSAPSNHGAASRGGLQGPATGAVAPLVLRRALPVARADRGGSPRDRPRGAARRRPRKAARLRLQLAAGGVRGVVGFWRSWHCTWRSRATTCATSRA